MARSGVSARRSARHRASAPRSRARAPRHLPADPGLVKHARSPASCRGPAAPSRSRAPRQRRDHRYSRGRRASRQVQPDRLHPLPSRVRGSCGPDRKTVAPGSSRSVRHSAAPADRAPPHRAAEAGDGPGWSFGKAHDAIIVPHSERILNAWQAAEMQASKGAVFGERPLSRAQEMKMVSDVLESDRLLAPGAAVTPTPTEDSARAPFRRFRDAW